MYGKHFASMYEGSMVGAGAIPFAIMGYVIANYQLDQKVGAQVRLNPVLLAAILGEAEKDIEKGIEYLCAPDGKSSTKVENGRRLIQIGEFDYRVVNGAKYTAIKNEEERREANRLAKQRERAQKKVKSANSGPQSGEIAHQMASDNGASEAQLNSIVEETLPTEEADPL